MESIFDGGDFWYVECGCTSVIYMFDCIVVVVVGGLGMVGIMLACRSLCGVGWLVFGPEALAYVEWLLGLCVGLLVVDGFVGVSFVDVWLFFVCFMCLFLYHSYIWLVKLIKDYVHWMWVQQVMLVCLFCVFAKIGLVVVVGGW